MKKPLLRKLTAFLCFLLPIILFSQPIFACSADYDIWQNRSKNADPLYRFIEKGKAGYIDQKGKIVIKPTLDFYGNGGDEFLDGLLLTGISEGAYIDKTGKIALNKSYNRNWEFTDGLAVAMKENNGKWGYIDKTGKFVISPRFESSQSSYVYSFSENLAMIKVKNKYGYIDRTGEFVIQPSFLRGHDFSEGLARVVVEGPCAFTPEGPCGWTNGEIIGEQIEGKEDYPSCKFSFIDKSGNVITKQKFDDAKDFSEGLAAVQIDGKWGFINKQGRIVISPQFKDANLFSEGVDSFSDGLALFQQDELWGYINKQGTVVIPPKFDSAGKFSNGLAAVGKWNDEVKEFESYSYINKRGELAFKGKFAKASHFFKGLAHVKIVEPLNKESYFYTVGKFSYIDIKGKIVFSYDVTRADID